MSNNLFASDANVTSFPLLPDGRNRQPRQLTGTSLDSTADPISVPTYHRARRPKYLA
jgi:hypothetical protein